ncbi:class I SAM-dependent methyltransferase [Nocardioides sp. ChNu-153]|uniref:class I SAM-dependent methyltransferase n=1 Tax=Nocardioides sp. ChNu-153 TaxID=2779364 RepID=UPI0026506065|nr:class I SAM-dependent methyltransferase [Nocardioides sp. ChNu-153]MDN7122827.1 class I SAM-dependent methyltransferase [Nocardioides sp. ChNu-153]
MTLQQTAVGAPTTPGTTSGTGAGDDVDLQARLDRYWSGRAAAYHQRQVEGERAPHDRALWHRVWGGALPPAPARVLDVGTGTGYVASVLAELGHDVVGLDSSPGMLAEAEDDAARRRAAGLPAARYVLGDAVAPRGVAVGLDAVTSRYLLWTLRDPVTAIRAWARLLRPGGTVACVDANWYPGGIDRGVAVESADGPGAFGATYDAPTEAGLPLANATGVEDLVAVMEAAGLVGVRTTRLDEVAELDRRFGMSPGHESRPQYLVTGRTPA